MLHLTSMRLSQPCCVTPYVWEYGSRTVVHLTCMTIWQPSCMTRDKHEKTAALLCYTDFRCYTREHENMIAMLYCRLHLKSMRILKTAMLGKAWHAWEHGSHAALYLTCMRYGSNDGLNPTCLRILHLYFCTPSCTPVLCTPTVYFCSPVSDRIPSAGEESARYLTISRLTAPVLVQGRQQGEYCSQISWGRHHRIQIHPSQIRCSSRKCSLNPGRLTYRTCAIFSTLLYSDWQTLQI
jgi:hypothetical protein